MPAGVLEIGESEARVLQLLIHSPDGELAASFQTVVEPRHRREGRAVPLAGPTCAAGRGA